MLEKIKAIWQYIQDLMNVDGDAIMFVMTSVFIARVVLVVFGYHAITNSEAMMYSSAIATLGYSKTNGRPKQ